MIQAVKSNQTKREHPGTVVLKRYQVRRVCHRHICFVVLVVLFICSSCITPAHLVKQVNNMAMDLQLPELTTDDFHRAWTRFELIAAAKEWNNAKRLTIVPTLLRGKLIDYYTEFDDATKTDLATLKQALQVKAGLIKDPLVTSRSFNQRSQLSNEKVDEYASELKRLFKQAYPDEDMGSTVLLQKFMTGLQPPIARQMLLKQKPDNLTAAVKEAITVEYALQFDQTIPDREFGATCLPEQPINMMTDKNKHTDLSCTDQQSEYAKLQKTVEGLAKQLESLQATLHKPRETPPSRQSSRQNRSYRRPRPIGPCFNCGQEGHHYRQCPLNFYRPASKAGDCWPQLQ